MAGYKAEYTKEEQMQVLNYIISNNSMYNLRGTVVWKEMEKSGEFKRTWQSLKEHFRKQIYPKLHLFNLDDDHYKAIKLAYQETGKKSTNVKKEDLFVYDLSDSDGN